MLVKRKNLQKLKLDLVFDEMRMRNDTHKLKETFVDTVKFATDKDLVKYLYTLVMWEKIHEKVGKYRIGVNEMLKSKNVDIMKKKQMHCLT